MHSNPWDWVHPKVLYLKIYERSLQLKEVLENLIVNIHSSVLILKKGKMQD